MTTKTNYNFHHQHQVSQSCEKIKHKLSIKFTLKFTTEHYQQMVVIDNVNERRVYKKVRHLIFQSIKC